MLNFAKMGYYIMSYIFKILKILYQVLYPQLRYYIRYNIFEIYIFPTTVMRVFGLNLKWTRIAWISYKSTLQLKFTKFIHVMLDGLFPISKISVNVQHTKLNLEGEERELFRQLVSEYTFIRKWTKNKNDPDDICSKFVLCR